MNVFFYIKLFFLSGMILFSGEDSKAVDFKHLYHKSIDAPYDFGIADHLGNVYIISGKSLTKYNADGSKMATYTNQYFGSIELADATDPFRLLLYYEDFNQVVFLDNFLAEIGSPVNLDEMGYSNTRLVCNSGRGGFWLFDRRFNQLIYLNRNLQSVAKSQNLSGFIGEKQPTTIVERNQQLFMNVPDTGIFVFDQFANYIKTIHIKQADNVEFDKNNIYYSDNMQFYIYNMKQMEKINIKLPEQKNNMAVRMAANKIYIFKTNGYDVYDLQE